MANYYRFGFNGMEYENELYQPGNAYDFGARVYDGRIGRWFSVDPLAAKFAYISPFVFANSNPLIYIDPDGNEFVIADHLSAEEKERAEAALKMLSERMPEFYNMMNTLRYHQETKQFVWEGHENYKQAMNDGAISVIIEVRIGNTDGVERKDEVSLNPNQKTFNYVKTEKCDGEYAMVGFGFTPTTETVEGNIYPYTYDHNGEKVIIDSPEKAMSTQTYNNRGVLVPNGNTVHFIVTIDDYNGGVEGDGQHLAHELGHIEGDIFFQLVRFYFSIGGRRDDKGHQEGNYTGDNADAREDEFNAGQ